MPPTQSTSAPAFVAHDLSHGPWTQYLSLLRDA